jgi:hypothetical protein
MHRRTTADDVSDEDRGWLDYARRSDCHEDRSFVQCAGDWGTAPKKRWLCKAIRPDGGFVAQAPALVGGRGRSG